MRWNGFSALESDEYSAVEEEEEEEETLLKVAGRTISAQFHLHTHFGVFDRTAQQAELPNLPWKLQMLNSPCLWAPLRPLIFVRLKVMKSIYMGIITWLLSSAKHFSVF